MIGVNLWGVIHGDPHLPPDHARQGQGHIVNTASIAGLLPGSRPAYDASKHAVVAITEDLYKSRRTPACRSASACCAPAGSRTRILDAGRNWPDRSASAAGCARRRRRLGQFERVIAEGMPADAVAELGSPRR